MSPDIQPDIDEFVKRFINHLLIIQLVRRQGPHPRQFPLATSSRTTSTRQAWRTPWRPRAHQSA